MPHANVAKVDQKEADWSRFMARAQDGDQPAYETLLRAVIPHIRASARRGGVPPDRVDDVVQDVLLTIHRVRQTYDPARPFGPWLQAIIQRRTIDGQRRWGRQRLREVHAPLLSDLHADPAPSPIDGIERAAQRRRIEEAVQDLPPGQREAVRLLALDEQSLSEAASQTGRTTGALKVNLHRALKALKARLGGTENIEENQ